MKDAEVLLQGAERARKRRRVEDQPSLQQLAPRRKKKTRDYEEDHAQDKQESAEGAWRDDSKEFVDDQGDLDFKGKSESFESDAEDEQEEEKKAQPTEIKATAIEEKVPEKDAKPTTKLGWPVEADGLYIGYVGNASRAGYSSSAGGLSKAGWKIVWSKVNEDSRLLKLIGRPNGIEYSRRREIQSHWSHVHHFTSPFPSFSRSS